MLSRRVCSGVGCQVRHLGVPKPNKTGYPNTKYFVFRSAWVRPEVKGLVFQGDNRVPELSNASTAEERVDEALRGGETEDGYEKFPWEAYGRAISTSLFCTGLCLASCFVSFALYYKLSNERVASQQQRHQLKQLLALVNRLEAQNEAYKLEIRELKQVPAPLPS